MSYISSIRAKVGKERIFNPGVRAIILNQNGDVLLQLRIDTGYWCLPSGGVEIGETAFEALQREVFEETGLRVSRAEPMALYSGRQQQFEYPNGDQIQAFGMAFIVHQWSGIPRPDGEEGSELRFWPFDHLPEKIARIHIDVLNDFRRYSGKFILGGETPKPEELEGQSRVFCPAKNQRELVAAANQEYAKPDIHEFAYQSSIQETAKYTNIDNDYDPLIPFKPRLLETIAFAKNMKYKRLGLAFGVALADQAGNAEKVLREHGFEVVSVKCKAGKIGKKPIDANHKPKSAPEQSESMCNPVLQAMVLNNASTEFNILLGLGVGHDSLFLKYATSPCTVLVAQY